MSVADEIKRLTSDPGARKLGEYIDSVLARLSAAETKIAALEEKVAACCGDTIARRSAPAQPSAPAEPTTPAKPSVPPPTPPTPPTS